MSTLRADEILDASGGSNAVLYGVAAPDNSMGFRNRIINGDMRIDQRNAGASVTVNTASNQYSVDRWKVEGQATDGVFTAQQDSSVPTGFNNSLKITVTTADASIGSTQRYQVIQVLEGYNVADLGWGTANAKTVTLSFWVRSSLTGTFGGSLRNSLANRSYPFAYTISAANTWEYKSVTITGDTSGTWETGTGSGILPTFSMGSGTNFQGTAGAWNGNNNNTVTGETQLIATNGATFYITGVQLEAGSVATPFERRPYGTELALCQRYYEMSYNSGTAPGTASYTGGATAIYSRDLPNAILSAGRSEKFSVAKRSTPTMTMYSTGTGASGKIRDNGTAADVTANYYAVGQNSFGWYASTASSTTIINFEANWTASAEL